MLSAVVDQPAFHAGEVHLDDVAHGFGVGELDEVEEAAAQEGVGQFLLVVGGDDDDGPRVGLDGLAGLVDMELHPVEFLQQVVRELDVGLVDLVDEQYWPLVCGEGLPELAALDVVLDVVHALFAQAGCRAGGTRHRTRTGPAGPWWWT
jgi:hypothetical protein